MESVTSTETARANTIDRAHHMYKEGKYREALDCYTDALSMAKTKQQKIALHSNRAACYLKLYDFNEAAEECTSVLELDHNHTGALMLRAQTLVTLKDYHSAIFDVNRLIELNPSSEVYRNLQARLKTQLSLAPIPEDEAEFEEDEEENENDYDGNANMEEEEEYDEIEICENKEIDASNDAAIMLNSKSDFQKVDQRVEAVHSENEIRQTTPPHQQSSSLQTIPKPKGHTRLDYSKWDRFVDDSSDGEDRDSDDDEDEDSQPHYKFRVKTVGVKTVK